MFSNEFKISEKYESSNDIVIYTGENLDLLSAIPNKSIQLIVTSPPYNIGKEYEKRTALANYLSDQEKVIKECSRVLRDEGSICWQVGNFVSKGEIIPLDIVLFNIFSNLGFVMRNRIIWHFEHGLHSKKRFSGRYETINWFTKKGENYFFNLDPVRIPQKYPNKKYFKGPKAGRLSCNPLGKNPGDVWDIPNVKSNHVEKTEHPCQFPVGMIEKLVLSLTKPGEWVLDPYLGSGSTIIAAVKNNRKGAGADNVKQYTEISKQRVIQLLNGTLKTRPMNKPIYKPKKKADAETQLSIFKEGETCI